MRESVSVEDQQIKALETKLGLSGNAANGKKKLQKCVCWPIAGRLECEAD